jgi:hypothetical protein
MDPRRLFKLDFNTVLRMWKNKGERLLVCIDANKHVLSGKFMGHLMSNSMLELV